MVERIAQRQRIGFESIPLVVESMTEPENRCGKYSLSGGEYCSKQEKSLESIP